MKVPHTHHVDGLRDKLATRCPAPRAAESPASPAPLPIREPSDPPLAPCIPPRDIFPETALPLEKRSPETGGHLLQDGGAGQRWDGLSAPGAEGGDEGSHLVVHLSLEQLWPRYKQRAGRSRSCGLGSAF